MTVVPTGRPHQNPVVWGLWSVLSLSIFLHAGVDLWVQILIQTLLLSLWWIRNPLSSSATIRDSAFNPLWIVLLAWLGLSTVYSGYPNQSVHEWFNWIGYAAIFYLGSDCTSTERRQIESGVLVVGSILALCALWDLYVIKNVSPDLPLQTVLMSPNTIAGYLIIPLAIAATRLVESNGKNIALIVASAILLTSILFLRSTGVFLSISLAAIVFWTPSRVGKTAGTLWVVACFVIATIAGMGIKLTHGLDYDRLEWWKSGFLMIQAHPIFGNGLSTFDIGSPHIGSTTLHTLYAHNTWLQWATECGLGVVGIATIIWIAIRRQSNRWLAAGCLAVALHNIFDYTLILPAQALLFWMVASFCIPARQIPPVTKPATRRTPRVEVVVGALVSVAFLCFSFNQFLWNRRFTRTLYSLQQADLSPTFDRMAPILEHSPRSAEPWDVLAEGDLARSQLGASRSGCLNTTTAYLLSALERKPIDIGDWTALLLLSRELHQDAWRQELMRDLQTRPLLRQDKRIRAALLS